MTLKPALLLLLLAIPMLSACGSEEQPPPPTIEEKASKAASLYRTIFKAGQYERIPEAEAAMLAVYNEDSKQAEVTFLLGAMYFWSAAEWTRDSTRPQADFFDQVMKMDRFLSEAVELNPSDARAWCFLGAAKLTRWRSEGTPSLFTEATAFIDQCAEMYPHFGLLMVAITSGLQPANSPGFRKAVDAVWKNADVCVGTTMDRANPDFSPYVSRTANLELPFYACWNSPNIPHNLDTFWLIMGDLLVKNNQPDLARKVYANSQLDPGFASWKYKDFYFRQIETADQRAALYRDSNPANDPPIILQAAQCVICHSY